MRKVFVFLSVLCSTFLLCFLPINSQTVYASSSQAEIAMELTTGTVLHSYNENKVLPMASTTKIMTAILTIEDCDLEKVVTIPKEAVGVEGSSVYLKSDEQISIKDLLYGLMLRSGNDCATALAILHSGSVRQFVDVMNTRAKEMGAENTHFDNPSGLPSEEHYTTAKDLCKIACYAMHNPTFAEVVATKNYHGDFRSFTNKNKMLSNYEGANGVKTGYTVKAGRCLVSSAKREGMDVVTVVLNCPDMYQRSCDILDECFQKYALLTLNKNNVFLCGGIPSVLDSDISAVIEKGETSLKVSPLKNLSEVKKGEITGQLTIYSQNSLIFRHNLYSIVSVK
jgi:D-alanyl-D-alanine carboxypeptidase (penicillin-binding protein 5/6)